MWWLSRKMVLLKRMPDTTLEKRRPQTRMSQSAAEQARDDRLENAAGRSGAESDEQEDWSGTLRCAICLGSPEKPVKLPCTHEFCRMCIDALRSRGLKQLCPLCRRPLPPGAEKLREQADRLYT